MNRIFILILCVPFFLAACASEKGGDVYSRDQVQQVQHFKVGTVESLHKVHIEGTQSQIGSTAGTVVGAIAGSGANSGKTGEVAAVLGAVVGGMAGAAAEEAYTRENGIEYAIKLEDGDYISVVQAASKDIDIKAGDKVRVIDSDGVTRVVPF
jgi:outer membrane lipoprotein SlyB